VVCEKEDAKRVLDICDCEKTLLVLSMACLVLKSLIPLKSGISDKNNRGCPIAFSAYNR